MFVHYVHNPVHYSYLCLYNIIHGLVQHFVSQQQKMHTFSLLSLQYTMQYSGYISL